MTKEEAYHYIDNLKWLKGYDNTLIGGKTVGEILGGIKAMLEGQEAFINRLYHEIKARWNIRRQMPDASGEELKFLVDLLDRMEADGDEQELPKEGE